MAASVSSGRPVAFLGWESVIRAAFAESLSVISTFSTVPAAGAASIVAELGLTAMIGVPWVTVATTLNSPAKTDCVVWMPPSTDCTSIASVIRPESVLIAKRAAISLPDALLGMRTAAGETFSTRAARISACGATRYAAASASSMT